MGRKHIENSCDPAFNGTGNVRPFNQPFLNPKAEKRKRIEILKIVLNFSLQAERRFFRSI